jgi:hypothetical protein
MTVCYRCRAVLLLMPLAVLAPSLQSAAETPAVRAGTASEPSAARDGQRDFDWEIGTWKTRLKRRLRPLTGSDEWVDYEGT